MPRAIDIVVGCSDLKRFPPAEELRLRTVGGTFDERVAVWQSRLRSAKPVVPAGELYKGQHWSVVTSAVTAIQASGWRVRLWVASAGYGLLSASQSVAPYSATFASRHADSVWRGPCDGSRRSILASWWVNIGRAPLADCIGDGDGPIVVVAGADYVDALRSEVDDLGYYARRADDIAILSTSCRHEFAVRYTAALSGPLRCTLGSLNSRVLSALAGDAAHHQFERTRIQAWIDRKFGDARRPVRARRAETDAGLAVRIEGMRASQPTLAPSHGLRQLRADGVACSQERFRLLWNGLSQRARV